MITTEFCYFPVGNYALAVATTAK